MIEIWASDVSWYKDVCAVCELQCVNDITHAQTRWGFKKSLQEDKPHRHEREKEKRERATDRQKWEKYQSMLDYKTAL